MSCTITSGRASDNCKDAVGGIKGVYIINYSDILAASTTIVGTNDYKHVIEETGSMTAYYFETRREAAGLSINVNADPSTGTRFFEQNLSLTFNKLTQTQANQIKMLAYGSPNIIVEDNQGNLFLLGGSNGMDVTVGQMATGQNFGDANGFNVEMVGKEPVAFYTMVGSGSGGDAPFAAFPNITVPAN